MKPHARSGATTWLHWTRLAGVFLASQGLVQIVSLSVGLMLVHLLPVEQYALYTVASALLALLVLGANPGISQAVITQGARRSTDRPALAGLTSAALSQSRGLYLAMLPVLLGVSTVMLAPHDWSLWSKAIAVALVAAIGWMRVPIMIATALLNIRHDSNGLFQIGIGEGLARFALVPLCLIWPHAGIALIGGLAGTSLACWASLRRIGTLIDRGTAPTPAQTASIRRFIIPLAPMLVYAALQGQIAILIVSLFGNAASIAEVGAITRLNQIIALGMLLNPFLVQPIMARQLNRVRFFNRVGAIVAGLTAITAIVMLSAYIVPGWWLGVLGPSYGGLRSELLVALATGMLTLIGGTLYTVVISRNRTAGQHWAILPSILGQVIFVSLHGVANAFDALLLGLYPALVYATMQVVLLVRVAAEWPSLASNDGASG